MKEWISRGIVDLPAQTKMRRLEAVAIEELLKLIGFKSFFLFQPFFPDLSFCHSKNDLIGWDFLELGYDGFFF